MLFHLGFSIYDLEVDSVIITHINIIKQDIGFYLLKRAQTWVNSVFPSFLQPVDLSSKVLDPLPEICRF